jgi:hypothetical protein
MISVMRLHAAPARRWWWVIGTVAIGLLFLAVGSLAAPAAVTFS